MTTKTFSDSQNRMGRNPFGNAPKTASAKAPPRERPSLGNRVETPDHEGILLSALTLPLRSLVFGIKSLLIARYLFAHREEWKF